METCLKQENCTKNMPLNYVTQLMLSYTRPYKNKETKYYEPIPHFTCLCHNMIPFNVLEFNYVSFDAQCMINIWAIWSRGDRV